MLLRYTLIGALVTALDCVVFLTLLSRSGWGLSSAKAAAFGAAFAAGVAANAFWTFHGSRLRILRQVIKLAFVGAVGLGLSLGLIHLFARLAEPLLANLATSVFVVGWNFLANTYWTFRRIPPPALPKPDCSVDLSVILPAYNEAERITPTLEVVLAYLDGRERSGEVIVVDDGSSDDTAGVVGAFGERVRLLSLEKNQGKGAAVRAGMLAARGRYRLLADADNATPIEEADKLLAEVDEDGRRVVIGSRYVPGSSVTKKQSPLRVLIGRAGNLLIRSFLLDTQVHDTQCGFKLFPAGAAELLFSRQRITRWGFDMELIAMAHQFGLEVREVGVVWQDVGGSRLRPVRDALRTLVELLRIKLNFWMGRYS